MRGVELGDVTRNVGFFKKGRVIRSTSCKTLHFSTARRRSLLTSRPTTRPTHQPPTLAAGFLLCRLWLILASSQMIFSAGSLLRWLWIHSWLLVHLREKLGLCRITRGESIGAEQTYLPRRFPPLPEAHLPQPSPPLPNAPLFRSPSTPHLPQPVQLRAYLSTSSPAPTRSSRMVRSAASARFR